MTQPSDVELSHYAVTLFDLCLSVDLPLINAWLIPWPVLMIEAQTKQIVNQCQCIYLIFLQISSDYIDDDTLILFNVMCTTKSFKLIMCCDLLTTCCGTPQTGEGIQLPKLYTWSYMYNYVI